MDNQLCMRCMRQSGGLSVCKHCGFVYDPAAVPSTDQKPGTLLAGRYLLGCAAGRTPEMIQYIALDQKGAKRVAVYEYFPARWVRRERGRLRVKVAAGRDFRRGRQSFLKRMRDLSQMKQHADLGWVGDVWEENGTAYATAALCEDMTLEEHLRSHGGALMPEEAIPIAIQLCDALSALHERRLVCRTLSADRVTISGDGKVQLSWYPDMERLGSRWRTPDTVQGDGSARKDSVCTAAWDVYNIGLLLYTLLGGAPALGAGVRPGINIPPALEAVLTRALSAKPAARYQSAAELAAALEDLLEARPAARARPSKAGGKRLLYAAGILFVIGGAMIAQSFRVKAALGAPAEDPAITVTPYIAMDIIDISSSDGAEGSDGAADSDGVMDSDGAADSDGVMDSDGVAGSDGAAHSDGVVGSDGAADPGGSPDEDYPMIPPHGNIRPDDPGEPGWWDRLKEFALDKASGLTPKNSPRPGTE